MDYYAGIDVSMEYSSVCVVDGTGKIVREDKVVSEPAGLIGWFGSLGLSLTLDADRIGGRTFVAMAFCRHAQRRARGGAFGDAARAQCISDDAGEDGPQG